MKVVKALILISIFLFVVVGPLLPFFIHTKMTRMQLVVCGPCQCYKCRGWFQ